MKSMQHAFLHRALVGILALAFSFAAAPPMFSQQSGTKPSGPIPREAKPAEEVFENIQVLKGMPAADLQGAMSFIASSLGVDCDFCHEQDFGLDKEKHKLRAREMIRMVRQINETTFHGESVVNCYTCHRGQTAPVLIAPILPAATVTAAAPAAAESKPDTNALPTVDQVLDHYVEALGGQAALDRVKTRIVTTTPLGGGNSNSTTQLFQKAPGKVLLTWGSGGYTVWVGFNGQHAWAQDSEKSYWGLLNTPQRNSIMRDSELYPGSRLRSEYAKVSVIGQEKIGERDAYVVAGTSPEGTREKFFFDVRTGLLRRRSIEERTIFGWFRVQADYEAYRGVDGFMMPYVVRWSSPGGAWGTKVSTAVVDVRQNVPIEDEKFDHPPAP